MQQDPFGSPGKPKKSQKSSLNTSWMLADDPFGLMDDPFATPDVKRQEQLKQEKLKQEQIRQEQIRQEQLRQEQIRQEQIRQEQLRQEQIRQEQIRQEQLRQEQLRQEQLRQEQLRQEQLRQEQLRQEQIRQEQLRQEQLRQQQLRQEQIRQEQLRQEQIRQEQLRQEQLRQEQLRQEQLRQQEEQQKQNTTLAPKLIPLPTVTIPPASIPQQITPKNPTHPQVSIQSISLDQLEQYLHPYEEKINQLQTQVQQDQKLIQDLTLYIQNQTQEIKQSQATNSTNTSDPKQKDINIGFLNEITAQKEELNKLEKQVKEQTQNLQKKQLEIETHYQQIEQKQNAHHHLLAQLQTQQIASNLDFSDFNIWEKPSLWQRFKSIFKAKPRSNDFSPNLERERISWQVEQRENQANKPAQAYTSYSESKVPEVKTQILTEEDSQAQQLLKYKQQSKEIEHSQAQASSENQIDHQNLQNKAEKINIPSIRPNPSSEEYQVGGITLNKGVDLNSSTLYPVLMQQAKVIKKQEQSLRELAEAFFKLRDQQSQQEEHLKKTNQTLIKEFEELKKQVDKIQKTKDQSKALQDGLSHHDQRLAQIELQLEGLGSKLAEFDQKISAKDPSKQATDIRVSLDPALGDYTSIQEAIDAAPVGAYIGILPGLYEEVLEIQKPVKLIGLGKTQDVIIQVRGESCILLQRSGGIFQESLSENEEKEIRKKLQQYQPKEPEKQVGKGGLVNWVRKQVGNELVETQGVFESKTGTDEISIVNMTILSVTEQAGGAPNENPSILIRSGHLRMEKCDVRGENGAGIQVEGEGAELSMRNSKVLNTRGSGISLRTRAKATLSQCQIFKCKESGVDAQGFTSVRLTECEVVNNQRIGLQISFKSQVLAYHSIIAGNHFEGMWISNQSTGTVKGCDLRGNGRGPYDISPDSKVELVGNKP